MDEKVNPSRWRELAAREPHQTMVYTYKHTATLVLALKLLIRFYLAGGVHELQARASQEIPTLRIGVSAVSLASPAPCETPETAGPVYPASIIPSIP